MTPRDWRWRPFARPPWYGVESGSPSRTPPGWQQGTRKPRAKSVFGRSAVSRATGAALVALIGVAATVSGCSAGDGPAVADRPSPLIPKPAEVEWSEGPGFVVTPQTRILVSPGNEAALRVGRMLSSFIGQSVADDPPAVEALADTDGEGSIQLVVDDTGDAEREGYRLEVTAGRIVISATDPAGLFYGVVSLRQLLPPFLEWRGLLPGKGGPVTAPAVRISDRPRYQWRGMMLDVARHFLPVPEVKRFIDYLALYKLNRLHLHLTDDQGWRIEIKSWPKLATVGGSTAVGGDPGGYYTQDQYRDIVAYAAERFIAVIPEIDLPSHVNAALASYPELNCDGESPPLYTGIEVGFNMICPDREVTFGFIEDVFGEVAAMTPTPWLHLGGDEAKTMTDEQYVKFVQRVQGIVAKLNKTVVGWDEIASTALQPGAIVQHWRPSNVPTLAVDKGAKVILSPADRIYLDQKYSDQTPIGLNWAANISVSDAYSWDPRTKFPGLTEAAILGVEAALWSETLVTVRDFEYMAFPRLPGVAEIGWSSGEDRQWNEYRNRLAAQADRWASLGINYYRSAEVPWPDGRQPAR
ncbi:MAG: beta-N-acetylhexosaminidase [Mycobacterium sp.]|nr:beta-N-acetylhexosaminidase [Mycobacterium sp.]